MATHATFDEPRLRGVVSTKPIPEFEEIQIAEGVKLDLRYKGKLATLVVTSVVEPQARFEGRIESFDRYDLEHEGLAHGDEVAFRYDEIERIHQS